MQFSIVLQTSAHERHQFGPQGHLMDLSAGIAGGEDPRRMTAASGAGAAAASVTDGAMEERATKNGAGMGKALKDALNPLLAVHFHCI